MSGSVLSMQNIDKRFPGVHALKQVSMELNTGEVLALVGENGAGKSTLMKILTGIYQADSGVMHYQDSPYHPRSPRHAMKLGLGIIHQELNLMDHLSVAENVFIGRESLQKNRILLDKKQQNDNTRKLFAKLGMDIDPEEPLGNLTVGKQQMVEIIRAISRDLKVLILDEPSAALTEKEIADLFGLMRNMKEQGVSMIYISHRLEEVHQISDRTAVLRDGEVIGISETRKLNREDIIQMMVGRTIFEKPKTKSDVASDSPVILKVEGLSAGSHVRDINFELRKGEILGFAGLIGSGRTETARTIFGADPMLQGRISMNGREVNVGSPSQAVSLGIGYLSADRKRYGLAVGLSVLNNILMSSYNRLSKGVMVPRRRAEKTVGEYIDMLKIKTPGVDQLVHYLSGGNQQKVVLAKWLLRDSQVLIFNEPTRGIDVGAKSEIYALMHELVNMGKSIIMISSELPEILRMSDRIVVMCEGRITGIVDIEDANQENIIKLATMRNYAVQHNEHTTNTSSEGVRV